MTFNDVANNCRSLYKSFRSAFESLVMEQVRVCRLYAVVLEELGEPNKDNVLPALVRFVPCDGSSITCFYCGELTSIGPDTVRNCLKKNSMYPAYIMGCCRRCDQSIYGAG